MSMYASISAFKSSGYNFKSKFMSTKLILKLIATTFKYLKLL